MSVAHPHTHEPSGCELTYVPVGPILRGFDVKDKTYQQTPVGQAVRRYFASREWGDLANNSLDSYETCLSRLARDHDDFHALTDFCAPDGPELLERFLQRHWPRETTKASTRAQRASAVRSFFQWAVENDVIPWSPAAKLKPPRVKNRERQPQPVGQLRKLIDKQDSLRDKVCLMLLAQMGLRKDELRRVEVRHVDLTSNEIVVHGKGGKVVILPIGFKRLRDDLYLLIQGQGLHPDEFLLYPKNHRRRPMDPASVHRWFKRCLVKAGMSEKIEMHSLRHSAADAIWRATGNLIVAQQLLRHESVATTQLYLHPNRDDLVAGMRAVEKVWAD